MSSEPAGLRIISSFLRIRFLNLRWSPHPHPRPRVQTGGLYLLSTSPGLRGAMADAGAGVWKMPDELRASCGARKQGSASKNKNRPKKTQKTKNNPPNPGWGPVSRERKSQPKSFQSQNNLNNKINNDSVGL